MAKFEQGLAGYGNRVVLTLANGFKIIFGHVAQGVNGRVQPGARIGTTGHDIGSSIGSVTLVEVHDPQGRPVNPHSIFDPIMRGAATVTGLFGAASGQIMAQADRFGASGDIPGVPAMDLGSAWDTLIKDLQAFPEEYRKNTAAQIDAIKPIGDFFGTVRELIQPKHLWSTLFVTTGGIMILVGVIIYFKGDEIVTAGRQAAGTAAKAAVTA